MTVLNFFTSGAGANDSEGVQCIGHQNGAMVLPGWVLHQHMYLCSTRSSCSNCISKVLSLGPIRPQSYRLLYWKFGRPILCTLAKIEWLHRLIYNTIRFLIWKCVALRSDLTQWQGIICDTVTAAIPEVATHLFHCSSLDFVNSS